MLDQEIRQRIMIQQEGIILANVANQGSVTACEIARCQIDGIANALIRMEGAKETSHFVFALSDRVAGGMRDVTDFFPKPIMIEEVAAPPVPEPEQAKGFLPSAEFARGFLFGLVVMAFVTMLALGMV